MARQIVRRTPKFPQGQSYVVPLLSEVLPGIDSNDMEKTKVTYEFINAILTLIPCVDCSSAVHTRDDLSDVRRRSIGARNAKRFSNRIDRERSLFIDGEIRRFHQRISQSNVSIDRSFSQ